MKFIKFINRWLLLLVMLLLGVAAFAAETGELSDSGNSIRRRVYMPGDLVHVVVGAPVDISEVLAEMPDKTRLKLNFERRTYTWHGHWEVPYGFDKGDYYAKLIATDVEGNIFEGRSSTFYIGEPSLVTLIGVDVKREVELNQEVAVARPQKAAPQVKPQPKPQPKPKTAPKPAAKPKPKPKPKPPKKAEKPKNFESMKARLITEARFHFKNNQYNSGKRKLQEILVWEPDNLELQTIIERIDEVIKAKEAK
ncbi:MAG: hypothetical protein ABH823_02880 [bacterium]